MRCTLYQTHVCISGMKHRNSEKVCNSPMLKRSVARIQTTAYHFVYTAQSPSFTPFECLFVCIHDLHICHLDGIVSMQTRAPTTTAAAAAATADAVASAAMSWPSKHPSFKYDDYESAAVSKMWYVQLCRHDKQKTFGSCSLYSQHVNAFSMAT